MSLVLAIVQDEKSALFPSDAVLRGLRWVADVIYVPTWSTYSSWVPGIAL
jgi:hypothetical protein